MERNGGSGNVRRLVRGPHVVKGPVRVHFGLTEEQRLAAQRVQNHVERASGDTVDGAVEIGLGSLRKGIEEHAKGLTRIQLGQERLPAGRKSGIWLRRYAGFTKLPEQVGGGGIRKAQISRTKVLIQNRRAQKVRHLLLFDRIARGGEDVAAAKKHGAGKTALEQLQKSELALFERELHVSATQLNPIGRLNFLERSGIHAKRIQLVVGFTDGFFGREDTSSQAT